MIPEPPSHLSPKEAEIYLEVAPRIPAHRMKKSPETVARYCQLLLLYRIAQELAALGPLGEDCLPNPGYGQVARIAPVLSRLEKDLGIL